MVIAASAPMKVCRKCGEAKPATSEHYGPHRLGKFGLEPRCRACKRVDAAELRQRPDQKSRQQAWRDANRAKVKEYNRSYREAGYKSTQHVAQWRAENIDAARKRDRDYMRAKRANDPKFRMLGRVRARLASMAQGRASRRTEELLGYTMAQLKEHIERQFQPGMGWHNMGEWEIDHILPVASFKIESVDDPDFKVCWGLPNLQPLWRDQNRRKNAKVLTLL